ncbi:hypothetical protein Peur_060845 [Populus x canadensis]
MASIDIIACGHKFCWEKKSIHRSLLINAPQAKIFVRIACNDEEERTSSKSSRGCPRSPTCDGCTPCVCFGCLKCRLVDCNCRICVDYMQTDMDGYRSSPD